MRERYHRRWGALARSGLLWGWLLTLGVGVGDAAGAAKLVDLRVGEHPEFTRVVFELDDEAAFNVEPFEKGSGEVLVTLDAESPVTTELSRSPLVESVRISPGPDGSVAHVKLRVDRVHVTEMVLREPDRIVLDVRALPRVAAAPVAAPEATPVTAAVEPVPTESMEEPAPPIETAGEASTSAPPAVDETDEGEAPALAEDSLRAEVVDEAELASASRTEEEPAIDDEPADAADAEAVADEEMAPPETASPPAVVERGAATSAAPPATSRAPTSPPSPEGFDYGSPYVLGGMAGLILVLFLVWRGLRRKATGPVKSSIPFPPEADAEPAEASAVGEAAEAPGGGAQETGSIFDGPAETDDDKEESVEVEAAMGTTNPRETPFAESLPGLEIGEVVHQLEQRIAKLESRIEDLVEAKERLERQVNAQTEELRVQRAAIARTQRVVRSLARPEEESIDTTPGAD